MKNDVCRKFLGLRLKKVQVCEEFITNKYLFIPVEVTGLLIQRIHLLIQETWVQSLGQEDPLEEEMATHSSILAGEYRGQRSLVGYSPWGRRVRHD